MNIQLYKLYTWITTERFFPSPTKGDKVKYVVITRIDKLTEVCIFVVL